MTALVHDVHWQTEQRRDCPEGIDFGEVLYADDTIIIGKTQGKYRKYCKESRKFPKHMD